MNKLQTIIDYAVKNGWKPEYLGWLRKAVEHPDDVGYFRVTKEEVIFKHDFLKAVFGEEKTFHKGGDVYQLPKEPHWQYHAQKIVISKDPVEYVFNWVEENKND